MGAQQPERVAMAISARVPTRLFEAFLDLIYPRRCGGCLRWGTWLCPDCLAIVVPPVVAGWACGVCGGPLVESDSGLDCPALCDPGDLSAVLCAAAYADPLGAAIRRMKYNGWRVLAPSLATLLAATCAATPLPWGADVRPHLVPVPLHPRRARERGFNQAALLARGLAGATAWPLLAGLVRVRNTPHQVGLLRAERAGNLEDAFAWRGPPPPAGPILLVDDVYTTGVTMQLCAEVLRAAGAGPVYGLALAGRHAAD